MPTYRCNRKNCGFATDNLDEFIQHIRKEERTSQATPKKRHMTAREYIECPECYKSLEPTLLKRGWTPPKKASEKKEEASEGGLEL